MIPEHVETPEPDHIKYHWTVLANYIIEHRLCRVAEIGVFMGQCMKSLLRSPAAVAVREYYGIDAWKPTGVPGGIWRGKTQEDWDGLYKKACKYMPWFPQLRILRMDSVEAAGYFWDEFFDLVYIDATHTFDGVTRDIRAWLPKVRLGGFIGGHDYTPGGELQGVVDAVDTFFGKDRVRLEKSSVWFVRKVLP